MSNEPRTSKLTVVESPFAGDIERNIRYARLCCLDCIRRNEMPYASHLLLTQVLDDTIGAERALGMSVGFAWAEHGELIAVYEDFGISGGMRAGIANAIARSQAIEYRRLPLNMLARVNNEAKWPFDAFRTT